MTNYKLTIKRKENKLKQTELAKKIGIHKQSYHLKESGKSDFTLTECRMIAQVLDCTLNDLFQGDNHVIEKGR